MLIFVFPKYYHTLSSMYMANPGHIVSNYIILSAFNAVPHTFSIRLYSLPLVQNQKRLNVP